MAPSGATAIAHKKGDVVSATSSAAGPRISLPWPSTDRFSTSPRRKSLRVAVCQKTGLDADSVVMAAAARANTTTQRENERISDYSMLIVSTRDPTTACSVG